jgi:hypothetical protein
MRTYLIIGAVALGLAGCSSDGNKTDVLKIDGKTHDLGPIVDQGPTPDGQKKDGTGKKDGTTTTGCPATTAAATVLTAGTPGPDVTGTIADPTKSECYYKIDGKKGDHLWLLTTAKADITDDTYLDTVITLFDSSKKQLAENDDPEFGLSNDAELYTVLPADGTYYVRIADCNFVKGASSCTPASGITHKDFTLNAMTLEYQWAAAEGAEPNDTQDKSTVLPYLKGSSGDAYLPSLGYGLFDTTTDVDVFTINIPSDLTLASNERAVGQVLPLIPGTSGNGSTGPVGKIYVVDPADPNHHFAEIDATVGVDPSKSLVPDISVPLKVNTPYYLYVTRTSGTAGNNEFYYFQHYVYSSNPLETAEGAGASFTPKNDTPATAFALTASTSGPSYFIEGDISASADVDYFSAAVPTGLTDFTVSLVCGAQRSGSGLRGLKLSVFKSDGTTLLVTDSTVTEAATTDARLKELALGTEKTKIVLKVEATQTQDANVTSTFYRCGVHFY